MIEVQDHQQAMKYADPMIDLEETVRRGYNNDPYNDRNFFANGINEDILQQQQQQRDAQPQGLESVVGGGKALNPGALTRQEIQRDAHVYNLTPQRIVSETNSVRTSGRIPTAERIVSLHAAPVVQEQAGKNAGIPRSPGGEQQDNILNLLREFSMKTQQQARPGLTRDFTKQAERRGNSERINPLTGLPENIEDKAFGAVSSIESVGDDLPKPPQSIVVDLNHLKSSTAEATQAHQREIITTRGGDATTNQKFGGAAVRETKPKAPVDMSGLMAGTLGSNFDSIESFLQADQILRTKLNNN